LAQDGMPTVHLERGADLQQALVAAELVPSRGQARTLISSNAVSVNGEKQASADYVFDDADMLYGRYTLLRRSKKHYCLLNWQ
ncbi:tyrosine--tRNA ligase, partial [Sodalis-like symbiont of Bactericera trigonica]